MSSMFLVSEEGKNGQLAGLEMKIGGMLRFPSKVSNDDESYVRKCRAARNDIV